MKRKSILNLGLIVLILISGIGFISILGGYYRFSTDNNTNNLKTSSFRNISVGDCWTYITSASGSENYMSFEITSISDSLVYADMYSNGNFVSNTNIAGSYVLTDSSAENYESTYGTYSAIYGGRSLTVCDASTSYNTIIFDINTGIVVEGEISGSYYELISWDLYSGNSAPNNPTNPSPSDGSTDISTSPTLSVDVSDPDGDSMDVSFYDGSNNLIGTDTDVASGSSASVFWSGLSKDMTYDWYVVVNDGSDIIQSSTWSFTTTTTNSAPNNPTNPSPSDSSIDISTSPTLSARVSDPDGDSMDVSFYDGSNNLIGMDTDVASGSSASVSWSGLSKDTTYDWYVVVDDGSDRIQSPTWEFTTKSNENSNPTTTNDYNIPSYDFYILIATFFGISTILVNKTINRK